jgi:hypothetical protein
MLLLLSLLQWAAQPVALQGATTARVMSILLLLRLLLPPLLLLLLLRVSSCARCYR